MSNILRSVRRFMPSVEEREDVDMTRASSSSEFHTMGERNQHHRASRSRTSSRSSSTYDDATSISVDYMAAHNDNIMIKPHKAISPTSPSVANNQYQLMDEGGEEEARASAAAQRDGPPLVQQQSMMMTTTTLDVQQSLHRVQRRVSDGFRNLQDSVSKRLASPRSMSAPSVLASPNSPKTKRLLRTAQGGKTRNHAPSHSSSDYQQHDDDHHNDDNDESQGGVSDSARFLRKAVRGIRKSWSTKAMGNDNFVDNDMDNTGSSHPSRSMRSMDGYMLQKKKDDPVVFTATRDMELT